MRNVLMISTAAYAVAFAAPKDAGSAAPTPAAATPAADAKSPPKVVTFSAPIEVPARKKPRGPGSAFPFDGLAVGGAFGVAERTAKSLQTIIGNQNRKHLIDKLDANGSIVYETQELTGADGSKTIVPTTKAVKVASKRFYAVDVDAAKYEGASVLIVRES